MIKGVKGKIGSMYVNVLNESTLEWEKRQILEVYRGGDVPEEKVLLYSYLKKVTPAFLDATTEYTNNRLTLSSALKGELQLYGSVLLDDIPSIFKINTTIYDISMYHVIKEETSPYNEYWNSEMDKLWKKMPERGRRFRVSINGGTRHVADTSIETIILDGSTYEGDLDLYGTLSVPFTFVVKSLTNVDVKVNLIPYFAFSSTVEVLNFSRLGRTYTQTIPVKNAKADTIVSVKGLGDRLLTSLNNDKITLSGVVQRTNTHIEFDITLLEKFRADGSQWATDSNNLVGFPGGIANLPHSELTIDGYYDHNVSEAYVTWNPITKNIELKIIKSNETFEFNEDWTAIVGQEHLNVTYNKSNTDSNFSVNISNSADLLVYGFMVSKCIQRTYDTWITGEAFTDFITINKKYL